MIQAITDRLNMLCQGWNRVITQDLFLPEHVEAIPPLYAQDGKGMDATAYLKLFGAGRYTYYVTEACPISLRDGTHYGMALKDVPAGLTLDDVDLFGYIISPLGEDCDELGYSQLSEIAAVRFPPFGTSIERDEMFEPISLRDELARRWSKVVA